MHGPVLGVPQGVDMTSHDVAVVRPAARLPWWWRLVVSYLRCEGPGWGRLYALAGGNDPSRWRDAGRASMRGKLHGYAVEMDLANWSERLSWCLGRYHDLPIQMALRTVLRPGDCFVDVGANLGMLSLLARRLVGEQGEVRACEPNPELHRRFAATLAANGLHDVRQLRTALGATPGEARLREFAGHSGWGTLADHGPGGAAETASWQVPIAVGDELLADLAPQRPLVIKIDVEGFEVPVLQGLQRTLAERRPLVFVEVAEAHQTRAGHSIEALLAAIEPHGYRGYALALRRRLPWGRRLTLTPFAAAKGSEIDALFVPEHGVLTERLAAAGLRL